MVVEDDSLDNMVIGTRPTPIECFLQIRREIIEVNVNGDVLQMCEDFFQDDFAGFPRESWSRELGVDFRIRRDNVYPA